MVIFFSASIYHANTVLVHQAALKVKVLYFFLIEIKMNILVIS